MKILDNIIEVSTMRAEKSTHKAYSQGLKPVVTHHASKGTNYCILQRFGSPGLITENKCHC